VVLISMALYGAVLATSSGGAMVSVERMSGWSRQLRITPLQPTAYIAIKMITSLVLAGGAVTAVYLVGILSHKPAMPVALWVASGLFIPLSQFSHTFRMLAAYTPLYGLNQLVHYPLIQGNLNWTWVANLAIWMVIFTAGAAWRFRKDTARV